MHVGFKVQLVVEFYMYLSFVSRSVRYKAIARHASSRPMSYSRSVSSSRRSFFLGAYFQSPFGTRDTVSLSVPRRWASKAAWKFLTITLQEWGLPLSHPQCLAFVHGSLGLQLWVDCGSLRSFFLGGGGWDRGLTNGETWGDLLYHLCSRRVLKLESSRKHLVDFFLGWAKWAEAQWSYWIRLI